MIGKTAWIGAVCTLTERSTWEADELLHSLERKQLLQRVRHSSIDGEAEFNFTHALTRDVAYSQIRRQDRAQKHEAAAEWIERLAGERDDKAELLADHYHHALELRLALGENTTSLASKARMAFVEAARQAAAVYAHLAAARHYHAALELTQPDDNGARAESLLGEAKALFLANTPDVQLLQMAVQAQVTAEEWEPAAKAEHLLSLWYTDSEASAEQSQAHLAQAAEYAARVPPGEVMCHVAATQAFDLIVSGSASEALTLTEQMLPIAEHAGIEVGRMLLLETRGLARGWLGDAGGLDDMLTAAEALAGRQHLGHRRLCDLAACCSASAAPAAEEA